MEAFNLVNIEPHIEVYDVERITQTSYGNAGKVALIGAFPTSTFQLDIFTSLDEAKAALKGTYTVNGDNDVPATFVSFYCLDYIFNSNNQSRGAESVLIVNTNYGEETLATSSTNAKIDAACTLLTEEDFDILTIAENTALAVADNNNYIINPVWQTLKTFENTQYLNQKPFGIITGVDLTNATNSIVEAFKTVWKDRGIYKAVTTPVRIAGASTSCNIAQSGCWHAAFTSGRPVNRSETAKTYNGLIGENSKDAYPLTGTPTWKKLLDNGFHTTKYKNRRTGTIQCLSNITPADYDMKIERVKNYMIKRLTLADVLGEDNDRVTRAYVKGLFEYEKQLAINNNYIVNMEYSLSNISTDTIQANVKLYIADIVRVVVLNVALEVTAYEGA